MQKKVVLITGASSGIGKSVGEYLHQKGYKVYGSSRNPKHQELNGIHFVSLDVTQPETIQSAVDFIVKKEGQIDFLINNAGKGITGAMEEIPDQEVLNVFEEIGRASCRIECRSLDWK